MKIAIVSSGLWHIRRGIETWAATLAEGVSGRGSEVDVTLFCGSADTVSKFKVEDRMGDKNNNRRLTQINTDWGEDGRRSKIGVLTQVIPCLRRGSNINTVLTGIFSRFGGWRYGFGSEYQTEQATMAAGLIEALRTGNFDIVHLQDPWLALQLEKARKKGTHSAEVILAHGTEESIEFLNKFSHVQELSPYYLARHGGSSLLQGQTRHCIPNFVDTNVFKPADKRASRKSLGLPDDALIILSVGAVDHAHKRMRSLIDEFAMVERKDALLVIAGPCAGDSGLISYAGKLLGNRFRYFGDLTHSAMPGLYSAVDLFVLCSLSEIFGIVFLEAMACGVPCLGHKYPVTEWIIGGERAEGGNLPARHSSLSDGGRPEIAGGKCLDMTAKGFLAKFLAEVSPEWIMSRGRNARERVEKMFSTEVVVGQIVKMYEEVNNCQ